MTVYEFKKICDTEDVTLEYIVLTDEGEEQLSFYSYEGVWASDDATYGEGDDDTLYAKIKLTPNELADAEIISVKLGTFTEIKVRL